MTDVPNVVGDGEARSGRQIRTALIDGVTFTNRSLRYAEVNGRAIFEGDIILGQVEDLEADADLRRRIANSGRGLRRDVVTGDAFRWPGGVIPYEIDPAIPAQERITAAITHWHDQTPIRFVERNGQADYLRFIPSDGCSSWVGRQGGMQEVEVGPNCTAGNFIHELFHAVGAWHEQSREDRDLFVQIMWDNIAEEEKHNFDQHITDNDDVGAYDYGSVMHYGKTAFSSNGRDTIVPVQPGAVIGQRDGLSGLDIEAVRFMYPSLAWPGKDPKEGAKDRVSKDEDPKDGLKDPFGDLKTPEDEPVKDAKLDSTLKEEPKERYEEVPTLAKPYPGAYGERSDVRYPGGVPFVLGSGGGAQPRRYGPEEQAVNQLLGQYQLLLGTYTRLHAQCGLDANAMAAWRDTAGAYARLLGGLG